LNWNLPGATRPANATIAVAPAILIVGSADSVPDGWMEPLMTGTLVGPKPLAKIRISSPGFCRSAHAWEKRGGAHQGSIEVYGGRIIGHQPEVQVAGIRHRHLSDRGGVVRPCRTVERVVLYHRCRAGFRTAPDRLPVFNAGKILRTGPCLEAVLERKTSEFR